MSGKARRLQKRIYNANRERTARIILELYQVIQAQPLRKRIAFAFRVIFRRLPK